MKTRLSRLRDLAVHLEGRIKAADGTDLASLSARYMDALKQIEEIERRAPVAKSPADELAKKRRQRRKPVKNGVARDA